MLGYTCLGRSKQMDRHMPLLLFIVTLIVTVAEAQRHSGPQIYTYGEPCSERFPQNLPYQIQTPIIPKSAPGSPSYLGPPGGKSYDYGISGPLSESKPLNVGFQLPVTVQQPILPQGGSGSSRSAVDHLRGRTYGVGIQSEQSSASQLLPSLGSFDFGIQQSIPTPKSQQLSQDPSSRFNVQVQHAGGPGGFGGSGGFGGPGGSGLWGPLPIGIERPAQEPKSQGGSGTAAPKRLTGLTSTVDRLLIPACDLPMGGVGSGSGQYGSGGVASGSGQYGSGVIGGSRSCGSSRRVSSSC